MRRPTLGVAAATTLLVATACGPESASTSGQSSSKAAGSPSTSPSSSGVDTMDTVACKPRTRVKEAARGVLSLCDAANDVWDVDRRLSFPDADIRTAVVRHQGDWLDVTLNFAAPIDPKSGHQVAIQIRTDAGAQPWVDMIFGPDQHDSWLYKNSAQDFDPACSPTLDKDLGHGRITVRVERRCLDNPRWVQVQIHHDRQGLRAETQFDYWDNPHNSRADPRGYTARVIHELRTS